LGQLFFVQYPVYQTATVAAKVLVVYDDWCFAAVGSTMKALVVGIHKILVFSL